MSIQSRSNPDRRRLLWPNEAFSALALCSKNEHLQRAILLSRIPQRLREMESELLAAWSQKDNYTINNQIRLLELLASQRLRQNDLEGCNCLLSHAEHLATKAGDQLDSNQDLRILRTSITLSSISQPPSFHGERGELLTLQYYLFKNNITKIESYAKQWPSHWTSPEALILEAQTFRQLNQPEAAARSLAQLLERHPGSAEVWKGIIELNHFAGRDNGMALSTASRLHPNDSGLLKHRVAMELYSRHGSKARRLALKTRVLESIDQTLPRNTQNDSNFIGAFDYCGSSYLLPHLHPKLLNSLPQNPTLHANLTMQLASLLVPEARQRARDHAATFPSEDLPAQQQRNPNQPLKVGLVSPDLGYHPVGRFIQMLLQGGFGAQGELYLISTDGDAMAETQQLAGGGYIHLANQPDEQKLQTIRSLKLDVAIDLAGWTGANNGWLFARRLAPLQVNFLGYFASSGLPSIDLWIGDTGLFPEPMNEWHSEKIVRLNRPFLAWSPSAHLPEGNLAVPEAPKGQITFGCFNHARKLSPATMRCWGELMDAVPFAQLALKSFASDDPGVRKILEGQMRRHGLNPKRITWLPTTVKPSDHLRQYGLIDVALDPFPNGGCTTTCEALWMGVPVITLEGTHYVSRMASAVLRGAGLQQWICTDENDYIARAQHLANNLSSHRKGRLALRQQLINSPLGDNKDWACQLWACLEQYSKS